MGIQAFAPRPFLTNRPHLQYRSKFGAGACFRSATLAGMNTNLYLENTICHADRRHPVDFLEPLPSPDDSVERVCQALSRYDGNGIGGASHSGSAHLPF